jgi:hypothetical protein
MDQVDKLNFNFKEIILKFFIVYNRQPIMPGYAANTEKRNTGQTEQEQAKQSQQPQQPQQHQQIQKYRNHMN